MKRISHRRFGLTRIAAFVAIAAFTLQIAAAAADADEMYGGIIAFALEESGAETVQQWLDGELTKNAGLTSEWYIFALAASGEGYSFTAYCDALSGYVYDNTIQNAVTRRKCALALIAAGRGGDPFVSATLADSAEQNGVMSRIYSLHLLNNTDADRSEAVEALLRLRLDDGGWALSGESSDVDVTAMAISALAPNIGCAGVSDVLDEAVSRLSEMQLDSGGFKTYGNENCESAAQVIIALSTLGIDCDRDERFIKNGVALGDVIAEYRLEDGSFSHVKGGEYSRVATMQTLNALIALKRLRAGEGSIYVYADAKAQTEPAALPEIEAALETEAEAALESEIITEAQTTAEAEAQLAAAQSPVQNTNESVGYKPIALAVIAALTAAVCVILFTLGKRGIKNYIFVTAVALLAAVVVAVTDFKPPEAFYGETAKENAVGAVTLSIDCKTIGEIESVYIPSDGIILPETELKIKDGDTVYDILVEAAKVYGIQFENDGTEKLAYISGINYLYEFDYGELSGWICTVNGRQISVGCAEYVLSDGDKIEWRYTLSLGTDIG